MKPIIHLNFMKPIINVKFIFFYRQMEFRYLNHHEARRFIPRNYIDKPLISVDKGSQV